MGRGTAELVLDWRAALQSKRINKDGGQSCKKPMRCTRKFREARRRVHHMSHQTAIQKTNRRAFLGRGTAELVLFLFEGVRAHRRCKPSPATPIHLERIHPNLTFRLQVLRPQTPHHVETAVATLAVTVDVTIYGNGHVRTNCCCWVVVGMTERP